MDRGQGTVQVTMDDLAESARQRLDSLLRVGRDPDLQMSSPDAYPGPGDPEWAVGFQDRARRVHLTVWFVRDTGAREEAARKLDQSHFRSSTNGPLLFGGRLDLPDDDAKDRLSELASRFAGKEKG